jgi:hypothetical protein
VFLLDYLDLYYKFSPLHPEKGRSKDDEIGRCGTILN